MMGNLRIWDLEFENRFAHWRLEDRRKSNGRISIAPMQSQTVYLKFTNVLALAVAVALFSSARPLAAGDTRVADAAERGDRQAVRALVKQRADVNAPQGDGMTGLHWAATNGDVEMAQALVTAGKIYALLDGRFNVSTDDIRAVALPALRHRIILNFEGEAEGITSESAVRAILDAVAVPTVE